MKQINFELDIGLFVLFLFTGSDFRLFRRVLAELSSHYCLYTISPEARQDRKIDGLWTTTKFNRPMMGNGVRGMEAEGF